MASVVLIIADISGYTRFMTRTAMSLAHAQAIITELLRSILHEIEIPLHVAEIEGDAVFFYGIEEPGVYGWEETIALISRKLLVFFSSFYHRLNQLQRSNMCPCNACRRVADLRLKLIVHVGEAMFYHIADFTKLSGPDVILVHRLLKNSIRGSEYLLMTESTYDAMRQHQTFGVERTTETYDELGHVTVYVHYPHLTEMPSTEEGTVSFIQKLKETLIVVTKGMAFRTGLRTPPKMRNLSGCTAPSGQE